LRTTSRRAAMFCPRVAFSWSELKDYTYWYMVWAKKNSAHVKRSDEGLTLETSALESLYGGQLTLSTQLIKPSYPVILPTDAAPQFLLKLTPSIRLGRRFG